MGEGATTAATGTPPLATRCAGVLLAVAPMPRPTRYRLRLRHRAAAAVSDRLADRALPVLLLGIVVLAVIGLLPRVDAALRLFWLGSALGLLTGLPYVHERRRLRRRLRDLPPAADPLEDLGAALPDDPAVALLLAGDARGALDAVAGRDRDDAAALRVGAVAAAALGDHRAARARALRAVQVEPPVWQVPAETGLYLCRQGRFGEGIRLLERAAEVAGGHYWAELTLANGMAMAGRLREAAEAFDRARGAGPGRRL